MWQKLKEGMTTRQVSEILGVKGNRVRIGVDAPKDVAVHRGEIHERIKRGEASEKSM